MCMKDASRLSTPCFRMPPSFAPAESCTSGACPPCPPRSSRTCQPRPPRPLTTRHTPNVDNIAKLVLDAINSRSFVDGQLC